MDISVIGCGRWGSLIAWYLDRKGHSISLYGRATSKNMQRIIGERKNEYIEIPESIALTTEMKTATDAEIIIISVASQALRSVLSELKGYELSGKTIVLCMKGIEIETGLRLSQIVNEILGNNIKLAVWLGPGHVQDFYNNIPNCMVIDSEDEDTKHRLVDLFTSDLIRFYYGNDLIGNELGAAAKNVIGIAAGMLDGVGLSSLKGALMSRSTHEVAKLIEAMGGNGISAYGLCHLGDYQATVFSPYSHNRQFGECFIRKENFPSLAEGYYTAAAIKKLAENYNVDMPICSAVYELLYRGADPQKILNDLFSREIKNEN